MKEKTRDITMRADEMVQRPKALNDLKDLLNASSGTADALKEMLNTPQFLTIQDDLYNLERLINKTKVVEIYLFIHISLSFLFVVYISFFILISLCHFYF